MKIATLQTCSTPDVSENLDMARTLVQQAAAQGAELVVLPEYFCSMGLRDTDKLQWREAYGQGPIQDALAQWAHAHGIWLAAGTIALQASSPERIRNSTLVYNPQGQCIARYDKIHLFRFNTGQEHYDESVVIEAGSAPVVVSVTDRRGQNWSVGLSVCYDLRFPELYRHYATQGVDLVLVPSAFTYTTGQAHWEVLLRARAIENQCYVAAAAQGGHHINGRRTWGHSMLIDPWGTIQAQCTQPGPGIATATVDLARLQQVRLQLPALQHRVL